MPEIEVSDDWEDDSSYWSGPFCEHYSDPADCEEACKACGKECRNHHGNDLDDEKCAEFVGGDE